MDKRISLFLGMEGSGKTTRALREVANEKRLIILDHINQEINQGLIVRDLDSLVDWVERSPDEFRLCAWLSKDEEIDELLEYVYELGDLTLLIDEMDTLCDGGRLRPGLHNIVASGRHSSVSLVGISQVPHDFPKRLRSQTRKFFVFQMQEEDDVKWIAKRGFDPEEVKALPLHECLVKTY